MSITFGIKTDIVIKDLITIQVSFECCDTHQEFDTSNGKKRQPDERFE